MVGNNSGKRNPDHENISGQAVRRYRSSCQGHSVEARQVCRHKLKSYLAKCAYIERTVLRDQEFNRESKRDRIRGVHFVKTQVISERLPLRVDNVSLCSTVLICIYCSGRARSRGFKDALQFQSGAIPKQNDWPLRY